MRCEQPVERRSGLGDAARRPEPAGVREAHFRIVGRGLERTIQGFACLVALAEAHLRIRDREQAPGGRARRIGLGGLEQFRVPASRQQDGLLDIAHGRGVGAGLDRALEFGTGAGRIADAQRQAREQDAARDVVRFAAERRLDIGHRRRVVAGVELGLRARDALLGIHQAIACRDRDETGQRNQQGRNGQLHRFALSEGSMPRICVDISSQKALASARAAPQSGWQRTARATIADGAGRRIDRTPYASCASASRFVRQPPTS